MSLFCCIIWHFPQNTVEPGALMVYDRFKHVFILFYHH